MSETPPPIDPNPSQTSVASTPTTGGGAQTAGSTVHDVINVLGDFGVKGVVERKIQEHDKETPDEKAEYTAEITTEINRLDVVITVGLYYTSLFMDWLTILGDSTSFGGFFVDLFFESFLVNKWRFGQLDVVGKISGMTSTLQTAIFSVAMVILFASKLTKKKIPSWISGPIYYGGPFQIFHLFNPEAFTYHESLQSLDAQLSQTIGVLSQMLIIIAATFASPDTTSSYNANILYGNGPNVTISLDDSSTNVTLRIKDTALFVTTVHFVSVVAIIMSSLLNIIQYTADIWRVNSDDIFVYYVFKKLTMILTCYYCCGGKNVVGTDTSSTRDISKRPGLKSTDFDPYKPPEIVVDKHEQHTPASRLHRLIETSSGVSVKRASSIRKSRNPSISSGTSKLSNVSND